MPDTAIAADSDFSGVWIGDLPEAEQLKRFERLKRHFREIGENFKDRKAGERCFMSEAYVDARLSLVVYFYLSGAAARELQHRSLFDGNKGICNAVAAIVFNVQAEKSGNLGDGDEELVLVDVVKLRQFPDLKLASRVRLYLIEDEIGEPWQLAPYRFVPLRGFYLGSFLFDRKADPIRIDAGKIHHDIIEGRPQIVNSVPNDHGEFGWVRGRRIDLDKIVSGLTVLLDGNFAEVRLKEGNDRLYVLANVAVAPFNL